MTQQVMRPISPIITEILYDDHWEDICDEYDLLPDTIDIIDGRVFNAIATALDIEDADRGWSSLEAQVIVYKEGIQLLEDGESITFDTAATSQSETDDESDTQDVNGMAKKVAKKRVAIERANAQHSQSITVMPFNNEVFDAHLEPIRLDVDNAEPEETERTSRIFKELSHWHNAKRPISNTAPNPKATFWANRRNQWFMAEMQAYAASLTNSTGKALQADSVISGSSGYSDKAESKKDTAKPAAKGPAKKGAKVGGKAAALESAAALKATKTEAKDAKELKFWHATLKEIQAEQSLELRYQGLVRHLNSLSDSKGAVAAEAQLYILDVLLKIWIRSISNPNLGVAALIWDRVRGLSGISDSLTKTISKRIQATIQVLGMPALPFTEPSFDRPLPVPFILDQLKPAQLKDLSLPNEESPKEFQLLHCGPYMDRSMDSAPDARVPFNPDGWQRKVLDEIDANKSLLVVAPTSAGKTFISFYAMRRILEADDDGVLVYVAPTKALVNQIAAEIQARYSKSFKHAGKSVWGIHTRDYRINNPTGCQVLVTVPHILQIMLLAPSNAEKKNSWSNRVKRIIFDEVHCIGQAEDGIIWEQLLLFAPCPIIALSATVGNPEEFNDWLASTQKASNREMVMIKHPHRYSDLRKYVYSPPKTFTFDGLPDRPAVSAPGLDGVASLADFHPVASLINKSRGMPDDLSLEGRDCLLLWRSMIKHQKPGFELDARLHPSKALGNDIIRKPDVIKWEGQLKAVLRAWMSKADSPFEAVREELSLPLRSISRQPHQRSSASLNQAEKNGDNENEVNPNDLSSTTLPLLCDLEAKGALPAILFNYDRTACEKLGRRICDELKDAEDAWKKNSTGWKKKVADWEEWKKAQEKMAKKAPPKVSKKKGKKGDDEDDEGPSKADLAKDAASTDTSPWARFDPDAPQPAYSFADSKKMLVSEMEVYERQMRKRHVHDWLLMALRRGIGIHHAGKHRHQICHAPD